ncbi:hypothetical protein [uncultured Flavobacterium sp.]|uniref:hypothetical protein n=1 Tax=uncultured Flavobacterium sp. TaxID=165435 RepID=UPI0030CA47F4
MAGEGSMLHAIITMKNNRRDRKSKLERLKNTSNHREEFIDHKKASPELLRKIRTRLQFENKTRMRKAIIKTSIILIVMCSAVYFINEHWRKILNFISI